MFLYFSQSKKDLSVEFRERTVARHRFGEGYQKMSASLKVPWNKVASIIIKWKKFGTTKTLVEQDLEQDAQE